MTSRSFYLMLSMKPLESLQLINCFCGKNKINKRLIGTRAISKLATWPPWTHDYKCTQRHTHNCQVLSPHHQQQQQQQQLQQPHHLKLMWVLFETWETHNIPSRACEHFYGVTPKRALPKSIQNSSQCFSWAAAVVRGYWKKEPQKMLCIEWVNGTFKLDSI